MFNIFAKSPIRTLAFLVSVALCLGLFTACGQGGKARYEFSPLNEDQVLDQFSKARTAEQRVAVVNRIRAGGVVPGFSFGRLWSNPRAVEMCQSLDDESMRLLLGTADESCSRKDFRQFVELILACDKHYDFVIGEVRRCQTKLPPRLVLRIASRLEDGGVPEETVKDLQEAAGVALAAVDDTRDPMHRVHGRGISPGHPAFTTAWETRQTMIANGDLPDRRARQYAPDGMAWEVPASVTLLCNEFAGGVSEDELEGWQETICDMDRLTARMVRREFRRRGDTESLDEFREIRRSCP